MESPGNRRPYQEAYSYNNDNGYNSLEGAWQLPLAAAGHYPPLEQGPAWFSSASYCGRTFTSAPALPTTRADVRARTPQENRIPVVPSSPFVRSDAQRHDTPVVPPPHLSRIQEREVVSPVVPTEAHEGEQLPDVSAHETAKVDVAPKADQRMPSRDHSHQQSRPADSATTAEHKSQTAETTRTANQQLLPTAEAVATSDQQGDASDLASAKGNHVETRLLSRTTNWQQQSATETVTTDKQLFSVVFLFFFFLLLLLSVFLLLPEEDLVSKALVCLYHRSSSIGEYSFLVLFLTLSIN